MDQLTQLAIKYGTDKWGKHHYTPVYHEMFKDRRNEIYRLLEIGPAEGAGVKMFRDYFPEAYIFGLEVDSDRVKNLDGEERIKIIQGDQSNIKDLIRMDIARVMFSSLDIVIDDGSHNPLDQIFTFQAIFPYLKKGATYIIEDVADDDVINILSHKYYLEVKSLSSRYDDRLIICRKQA